MLGSLSFKGFLCSLNISLCPSAETIIRGPPQRLWPLRTDIVSVLGFFFSSLSVKSWPLQSLTIAFISCTLHFCDVAQVLAEHLRVTALTQLVNSRMKTDSQIKATGLILSLILILSEPRKQTAHCLLFYKILLWAFWGVWGVSESICLIFSESDGRRQL